MNFLFAHPNFPGQFGPLARGLAQRGHSVRATALGPGEHFSWFGVGVTPYQIEDVPPSEAIHPWVVNFIPKIQRAKGCISAGEILREEGFTPDVIIAHAGWGEAMYLDEVWPHAALALYCEWYDGPTIAPAGFDPEQPYADAHIEKRCQVRTNNLIQDHQLQKAIAGLSPTHWQAAAYPERYREKLTIIHDGVDTVSIRPAKGRSLCIDNRSINNNSRLVTYVARHLEPLRGFHIFMKAIPMILRECPDSEVIIVGDEARGYGSTPHDGQSWFDIHSEQLFEVLSPAEKRKVHFVGHVSREIFTTLLQLSWVHVYLTYPFVLSWSLIEAMAAGCAIVASNNEPVSEVLCDSTSALLVDFGDHQGVGEGVVRLLHDRSLALHLSKNARELAVRDYDLTSVCLPRQLQWAESLV